MTLLDDQIPLARKSDIDAPQQGGGLFTIIDDDVPLSNLPQTGGTAGAGGGLIGSLFSFFGLLSLFGGKNKEDDKGPIIKK